MPLGPNLHKIGTLKVETLGHHRLLMCSITLVLFLQLQLPMHPHTVRLNLSQICRSKYFLVIHPMMKASSFGNLDHRTLVQCSKYPTTPFYQIFAELANGFGFYKGLQLQQILRQSLLWSEVRANSQTLTWKLSKGMGKCYKEITTYTVGFMVMPGFSVGKASIKS